MLTKQNPDTIHPPLGSYSHTVLVPANAEWLVISGQVGVDKKGKPANGVERQSERAFRNILACLKANRMKAEHIVKLTVFLTDARYVAAFRAAREAACGSTNTPPEAVRNGFEPHPGSRGSRNRRPRPPCRSPTADCTNGSGASVWWSHTGLVGRLRLA